MDLTNSKSYSRRTFIAQGVTLASAAWTIPYFLQRSALGLPMPAEGLSSIPGVPEDHVLVVLQLAGGNDGLNTVVPFADDAYYKARPAIGVRADRVLKLGARDNVGLHPALEALKEIHDQGQLSIVQGVGYPNPNRSHFKSMDIWHTAETSGTGTGWLGRYFDNDCCGVDEHGQKEPDPLAGIAIGREAPLAMQGVLSKPVSFENTDLFRWMGGDVHGDLAAPYSHITRQGLVGGVDPNTNAGFLMRTALDAQLSSEQIRSAVNLRPLVPYPQSDLARQLAMVAAMIRAGLRTRVYYVHHGGFDTHAGQGGENGRHATLLRQFAEALGAFRLDLKAAGNDGRVLTVSFSEFGRRVGQNASGGTDHGTAAPMFLMGPMVSAGLLGRYPSLTDLDQGDLKHTTDFRSVYAGVLEGWLGADSKAILDGAYRPVQVVKKPA